MSRVLVVEDNAMSRELARALLEHAGHDVFDAFSADSARRAMASGPFELIVMDIQFPGGGGEALLKELRAEGATMPVMALTALAMAGDRERLLRNGFNGYVSKPIDTRVFLGEVARLLSPGGQTS